ncbi:MAG: SBBP repeat-containing protein, partial [Roseiflexaceae bacterium]
AVRFLVRSRGGTFFFGATEAVLTVPIADPNAPVVERGRRHGPHARVAGTSVVRLRYDGANPQSALRPGQRLLGVVNFLTGNDPRTWLTNLATYDSLSYAQLYTGVDLRYEGVDGQLKRTYLVAAGADPGRIRWRYQGATDAHLDAATGDLVISLAGPAQGLPGATLRERAPIAWQEIGGQRTRVDVRYAVGANGSIGFALGAYDTAQLLTIDPLLSYSTFLGGSGNDEGNAITVDASGNAYVAGGTFSSNFPTAGPLQGARAGSEDVFISKVSADGTTLLYSTFLGGSKEDEAHGIVLDASGNIVLAGETQSSNYPTQNALDSTFGVSTCTGGDPCEDAFVTKLNAAGSALLYSTYLGGNGTDEGQGVAVDSAGLIYATGFITSSSGLTMLNAYDSSINGLADAFVVKLNPALSGSSSLLYSTYLGGGDDDLGNAIAVGSAGAVYLTGETASSGATSFPTQNARQSTKGSGSSSDIFFTKLDTTASGGASLLYSSYLGGSSYDKGLGIALDSTTGYAYLTGYTQSTNFPTLTPLQASRAGDKDAFVAVFNPAASGSASLLYSSYLGGTLEDRGFGIARDSAGVLYLTSLTRSNNFPTASPIQSSIGGGTCGTNPCSDVFVTQFDLAHNTLGWSTYLGGNNDDEGDAIAVDGIGAALITGITTSSNFPTSIGARQGTYGGGSRDAFAVRIGSGAAPIGNQPPIVNAGPNQAIALPTSSATLSGSAQDDGLPSAMLITTWTLVFGPGTVTFGNAHAASTTATFSAPGVYVLRLSAGDGVFTRADDTLIAIMGANQAPLVNAGLDQTIASTLTILPLAGAVRDDGLPLNQTLSLAWSMVSGPGTAAFGASTQAQTTVRFSATGTYVLRLTANDSALTGSDDVVVVVSNTTTLPSASLILLPWHVSGDNDRIWRWADAAWTALTPPQAGWYWFYLEVNPFNANQWLLLGNARDDGQINKFDTRNGLFRAKGTSVSPVYYSADAGQTWAELTLPHPFITDETSGYYACADISQLHWSMQTPNTWIAVGYSDSHCPNTSYVWWGTAGSTGAQVSAGPVLSSGQAFGPSTIGLQDEAVFTTQYPGPSLLRVVAPGATGWTTPSGSNPGFSGASWTMERAPGSSPLVALLGDNQLYVTDDYRSSQPSLRTSGTSGSSLAGLTGDRWYVGGRAGGIVELTGLSGTISAQGVTSSTETIGYIRGDRQTRSVVAARILYNANASSSTDSYLSLDGTTWQRIAGPPNVLATQLADRVEVIGPHTATPPPTPTPTPGGTPTATPTPNGTPTSTPTPTPPPPPVTGQILAIPGWIKSPLNRSTVSGQVPIVLTDTITLSSGSLDYWPADDPNAVTTLAGS